MGFGSFVKKSFKKVTGAVKKVGRSIKKAASSVWRGVKNKIIKPIAGLINKLGPIGMIAMSFVLPGLGTMLGGLWTSAATALSAPAAGAFANAIGQGMTWAGNAFTQAQGFISKGYKSITQTVTDGLKHIGGTIKDGAAGMWNSAKEFVGLPSVPTDPLKAGELIGKSAQKGFAEAAVQANPELLRAANGNVLKAGEIAKQQGAFIDASRQGAFAGKQTFDLTANPELIKPTNNIDFAKNLARQQEGALNVGKSALEANPEFLRMAGGNIEQAQALATSQEANLGRSTAAFSGEKGAFTRSIEATGTVAKTSSLDKIVKALSSSFGTEEAQQPGFVPLSGQAEFAQIAGSRLGVGGTGSAGGQFLDQSILAQIQAQARRLEELG